MYHNVANLNQYLCRGFQVCRYAMWLTNILEEVEVQKLQQVSTAVKTNHAKTLHWRILICGLLVIVEDYTMCVLLLVVLFMANKTPLLA